MNIGVDIDGTIKDTHRAAVQVYNEELNQTIEVEDVPEFYLDRAYRLTRQEGAKMWRKLEEKIYTLGLPLPHASEVLNELVESGHKVFFITARPGMRNLRKVTIDWLQKHEFPYTGRNLVMSAQDKAKVANEIGIDLFFEDAPKHLENLCKNRIPTVIVDASYNRDFPIPLKRITDWRQVHEIISKHS
ncbi:5' nucleotidase, NT5C type [Hazenella coriacea]|uniref:Nucleotidase n=1 Tax=Hazenella coriacea TaxID=1179467 RepID=A0A4V2UV93_9BACL|nr:HAD hydrolase-like protein [Hazenella coriacea]TCS94907.1 hypothetical protein EDD58_103331 [Hazenella coriacea]